ncbi:BEL1-like homeodomain protein 2 [Tasmannia lanceolata]|uniref:BEL1-like homeodomain protein 2 n=1 Tax=Tasmannia lanceolata TaxID=3420 RepID=UPI004063BC32
MSIATQPLLPHPNLLAKIALSFAPNSTTSMSQGFPQGIFNFSDGFDNSTHQEQHHHQHIAQQSRRDKLRVQSGFEPPLLAMEDEEEPSTAYGMLSEMFNFPPATTADLLENQIQANYRLHRHPAANGSNWYGNRQRVGWPREGKGVENRVNNSENNNLAVHQHRIAGINADSAAAMQLFLMNPQPRSPSPTPTPPPSTRPLHMLLPNPNPPTLQNPSTLGNIPIPTSHFTWVSAGGGENNPNSNKIGVENQGLSLSLSSSLQQLEANKAEQLRMGDGVLYYNQGPSLGHGQTLGHNHQHQVHVGFGSMSVVNLLRNSRYVKAAQELLEEFCSVGRGQLKGNRHGRHNPSINPNPSLVSGGHGRPNPSTNPNPSLVSGGASSSTSKDLPPLSPSERFEHQRRKAKLLSMLDEVDRRYNHYCEQMQMVVNSFESVMGFRAATPYTALAQKAMSRHFRCLKDAITTQLKITCEFLGDKDGGGASGVTKGETPRLRMLEQSLRQERAFHQFGMMEQETWRPQRGLPERSVSILRAWLFEHFLHPYPSDADKHLLARQTGLSRNQVSNWFINARVRLWKPMVEDMYQQESKENEEDERETNKEGKTHQRAQTSKPTTDTTTGKRSEFNAIENDPSQNTINRQQQQLFSENQVAAGDVGQIPAPALAMTHEPDMQRGGMAVLSQEDTCHMGEFGTTGNGPTMVRFGTSGDVSLTLGLRHAGNMPEKTRFSIRDFGGC